MRQPLANPIERGLYIALAISYILMLVLVGFAISIGLKLDQQLKDDQARTLRARDRTTQIITEIKNQNDLQRSYIQCIADFFDQPNRASLTLSSLDNCQIQNTGNTKSVGATPSKTSLTLPDNSPTPAPKPTSTPTPLVLAPTSTPQPPPPGQQTLFERIVKAITSLRL